MTKGPNDGIFRRPMSLEQNPLRIVNKYVHNADGLRNKGIGHVKKIRQHKSTMIIYNNMRDKKEAKWLELEERLSRELKTGI